MGERAEWERKRKEKEAQIKAENEKKREEEKKKAEEDAIKKAEEDKIAAEKEAKRKEEEAKVLKQQQATLNILRVLQKLSAARPENLDEILKELDEVTEKELGETGDQEETLKKESERVREYAKTNCEKIAK